MAGEGLAGWLVVAYVGPGSGLAISVSLLTGLLVVAGAVVWPVVLPLGLVWRVLKGRHVRSRRRWRRVVVLGLDGLDPKLVGRLIHRGALPNMARLAQTGYFGPLETVSPALTPAAWSSFMTGVDPSVHGIYDFITRDPQTYLPRLSSCEIAAGGGAGVPGWLRLLFPAGRAKGLRKGRAFWETLASSGVEATVLRVPMTFPPGRFPGRLLSGMCVPDLLGTQGTYTLFTTRADGLPQAEKGQVVLLKLEQGIARAAIAGPEHPLRAGRRLALPIRLQQSEGEEGLTLRICGHRVKLRPGELSDWVRVVFRAGLIRLRGLVQFYLRSTRPYIELYMSAIHLDPEKPPMALAHPRMFSDYLAKRHGPFGTLGLMEDTSALDDGVLDDAGFLQQVWGMFEERKAAFFDVLDRGADDLVVCVFDTPDRIQHMFWGEVEDQPAQNERPAGRVVEQMHVEIDGLIGQTMRRLGEDELLLIVSDHGFTSFRRAVSLNGWLLRKGYLRLLPGAALGKDWLEGVDWSRTSAYAIGLAGIYLNVRGREARGIVEPDGEYERLACQIRAELESLTDDDPGLGDRCGVRAIRRVLITSQEYRGPLRCAGPDLIVGYESGYRCAWESARGQVTDWVICRNGRRWAGDHCVDSQHVPGVLMANRKLAASAASILDIAPTVLGAFGLAAPAHMRGVDLFATGG